MVSTQFKPEMVNFRLQASDFRLPVYISLMISTQMDGRSAVAYWTYEYTKPPHQRSFYDLNIALCKKRIKLSVSLLVGLLADILVTQNIMNTTI